MPGPCQFQARQGQQAGAGREQAADEGERLAQGAEPEPDEERGGKTGGAHGRTGLADGPEGQQERPDSDHAGNGVRDGRRSPQQYLVAARSGVVEQCLDREGAGGHDHHRRSCAEEADETAPQQDQAHREGDGDDGRQDLDSGESVAVDDAAQEGIGDPAVLGPVEVGGDAEDSQVAGLPGGAPVVRGGPQVEPEEAPDGDQCPGRRHEDDAHDRHRPAGGRAPAARPRRSGGTGPALLVLALGRSSAHSPVLRGSPSQRRSTGPTAVTPMCTVRRAPASESPSAAAVAAPPVFGLRSPGRRLVVAGAERLVHDGDSGGPCRVPARRKEW